MTTPNFQKLFEIVETQQGYFTTKQALEAGYIEKNHAYHVRTGHWLRVHRGIYKLVHFSQVPEFRPDLMFLYIWSRNREERPQGVFSHETAMALYEVSDLMPAKVHMSVPKKFRRHSEIPGALILHHNDVPETDTKWMHGFKVSSPLRTIIDLIEQNSVSMEFIEQGLQEALSRGLITRTEIKNKKMDADTRATIEAIIRKAA